MDKKYTLQGIIGCVLFGVGDWLLGFVDPAKVNGDVFTLSVQDTVLSIRH